MGIISTPPYILRNGEYLSILRVIELPLIVLAFSTELAYKAQLSYNNYCPKLNSYVEGGLSWTFPYNLKNFPISSDLCTPSNAVTTLISVSIYGQAIAFLVISIISLLHCLFALISYFCCWIHYDDGSNKKFNLANVDFIVSIVLGLAWLCGSIAWLVSVIQLDYATRYNKIHATILTLYPCIKNPDYCELKKSSSIEIIYASPIAGLVVALLYFGHLYAVWKNTTWYILRYNKAKNMDLESEIKNQNHIRRGDVRPTAPEYEVTVKKETVKFQTNVPESEYRRSPPPRPPPPYSYIPNNTVTLVSDKSVYVNTQHGSIHEPPVARVTRVKSAEWPEY